MKDLTLVVITKNAEATLSNCLSSASWISKKIVVDSGSNDRTIEIAKSFGADVYSQKWLGFGRQKQYAVSLAETKWVLCLDADEYLSQELSDSIQQAKEDYQAYVFPRSNKFLGKFLRHGEGYPDWSLRLFNKEFAKWTEDDVHEKVVALNGSLHVGRLRGVLMHESCQTISNYVNKQNCYTDIQADRLIRLGYKATWLDILFRPLARFVKFYIFKLGFLDGFPGLIHILIGCFTTFLKYVKIVSFHR